MFVQKLSNNKGIEKIMKSEYFDGMDQLEHLEPREVCDITLNLYLFHVCLEIMRVNYSNIYQHTIRLYINVKMKIILVTCHQYLDILIKIRNLLKKYSKDILIMY